MQYKERVHAYWLGKAIGGTLGTSHEGVLEPLQLTFYDPVPEGTLPNDDLDLQFGMDSSRPVALVRPCRSTGWWDW